MSGQATVTGHAEFDALLGEGGDEHHSQPSEFLRPDTKRIIFNWIPVMP
jgi:hypothetical protein